MSEKVGFIGWGSWARYGTQPFEIRPGGPCVESDPGTDAGIAAQGALTAKDPADLASQCPVVMMCVSDTPDVQAVIFGPRGVIEGAKPGTLVIDLSTISPQVTCEIASRLQEKGVHMIDAPVSGGSEGRPRAR